MKAHQVKTTRLLPMLALLIAGWVSAGAQASAAGMSVLDFPGGCAVLIKGTILPDDPARFERLMTERAECRAVAFDSQYGQELPAMRIGRMIRARQMLTKIPDDATCAGACLYAFVGGAVRSIDDKARVGVRMPSFAHSEPVVREIQRLIQQLGVRATEPVLISAERTSFQIAAALSQYLVAMDISTMVLMTAAETNATTTRWLSPAQLKELRIASPAP